MLNLVHVGLHQNPCHTQYPPSWSGIHMITARPSLAAYRKSQPFSTRRDFLSLQALCSSLLYEVGVEGSLSAPYTHFMLEE
ncbi:hypothetical protein Y1Q_0006849 [Alligator mississippiensis]|uniref:Uncharacterized protein n=1 Tax=Alligator mississippiensis TaxID=8496 RepID=A0A151M5Y1_ALLMI|nr:hypothetical protein Y1Q_0006849 [Alligator mississippiensis]